MIGLSDGSRVGVMGSAPRPRRSPAPRETSRQGRSAPRASAIRRTLIGLGAAESAGDCRNEGAVRSWPASSTEVRETLFPVRDGKDGPLPPLLVAMTLVTGLVDAFSYLVLGHVFVANMTGNVIFIVFALAGERGFSIASSLMALGSFGLGSLAGGRLGSRIGVHRGRLLWTAAGIQALFLASAVVVSVLAGDPYRPDTVMP